MTKVKSFSDFCHLIESQKSISEIFMDIFRNAAHGGRRFPWTRKKAPPPLGEEALICQRLSLPRRYLYYGKADRCMMRCLAVLAALYLVDVSVDDGDGGDVNHVAHGALEVGEVYRLVQPHLYGTDNLGFGTEGLQELVA